MFIQRSPRFRLAKVLGLVHVFLACVSLPLAVSDDHSATLADHYGPVRRAPALSFRIIEESSHGGLPMGAHTVSHRRSYHHATNEDDNYVLRRVPDPSRRRFHHNRPDLSRNTNTNANVNIYSHAGLGTLYSAKVPVSLIDTRDKKVEDDPAAIKLEAKLYSCITFRANIIILFGQILKAPNNKLTADQFASLDLILQALIHKRVYIFNLLPVLKKLQDAKKEGQFKLVMEALMNNVPVYMTSACKFWLDEIANQHVDIEGLIDSMEQPADFLMGLDAEVIDNCEVKVASEELEPFDEASEVTQATLGPVFVNVFYKLKNHEITLSQKLFGAILISLPIGSLDAVLEEYINYIWDAAQDNQIPNWEEVTPEIEYGTPYELINSVVKKLLSREDTPDVLKHAWKYILLHLKEVPSTFTDEYYTDMQMLLNGGKNVELILSMIHDDLAIPELVKLKDRLLTYIKDMNIDGIFQGMNKYIYQKPIDLLIALLVRIQGRTQDKDISDTATKLLSILISKEELGSFTLTIPADVDVMMLLDFLNIPDSDPVLTALIQQIQHYLEGNLDFLVALQDYILKEDKSECHRPIQCLLSVLKKIIDPAIAKLLGIPSTLLTVIQTLVDVILKVINTSVKCEIHDVLTVEPSQVLDLINVGLLPISQLPGSTILPGLLKPTGKPTLWPIPPLISTDWTGTLSKPDHPKPQSNETAEVLVQTYAGERVEESSPPTLATKDVELPEKPIQVELLQPKPRPNLIPKPTARPRPTIKPTSVPHIIQTFKPHLIPSVKPIIEPSIAPPILSSKKPPVSTTPANLLVAQEPPTKTPVDNPSLQVDNEPVLPPNLWYDRPMYVVIPKDDTPPYTVPTKPGSILDSEIVIEFPPIKELLQGFDLKTPFKPDELPDIPEILGPLKNIFGPYFVEEILSKHVDKSEYPTVISLVVEVLDQALEHPRVKTNIRLVKIIQRYLKGIDYICIIALFPVVIDSQKISSNVLYVTIDPDDPSVNSVDSEPPQRIPVGFMTLAIYHPKYSMQQVDPVNPYGTLLPSPGGGEDNPIQELINDGSLQGILGLDFDPLLYPNRGTLLITVLRKLVVSQRVKSSPWLLKILASYLKSIKSVALYTKIPRDYSIHIIELQQNNNVNWQPDTASLIVALSPARTQHELNKINLIKSFLETPNLLELLQIHTPSYSTTRGALLKMIFNAVLRDKKMVLDPKILAALKYYDSRILTKGHGALPIVWVWVQMFIIREEIPLGEIIESVIDYDKLPSELKISYNELMTYLSDNPQLLQGNDNFAFEKYNTKGTFLKGLFTHFVTEPAVSPQAKKYLKQLIPHIKLNGRGAEPMNHVTIDDITNGEADRNGFAVLLDG